MRNTAKHGVTSEYMLVIDVDEFLSSNMATHMEEVQKARKLTGQDDKAACVVRSFEWKKRVPDAELPTNMGLLKDQVAKELVTPKHNYFPAAYNPDGFDEKKPAT